MLNRRRLVRNVLLNLLTSKRLLIRKIPKLTGAQTVGDLNDFLSTDFSHVRFAPSLLPSSVANTRRCCNRFNRNRLHFHRKPVFTGLILTSRVGHTPTGIRTTLLRTVRRQRIAATNVRRTLPRLFLIVTARGPVRRRNACYLPRTRLSHFLLRLGISCPSTTSRRRVLHIIHRRHCNLGPTTRAMGGLPRTALLTTHTRINRIRIDTDVRHCVLSLIHTAHRTRHCSTHLNLRVTHKIDPHNALNLRRITQTGT